MSIEEILGLVTEFIDGDEVAFDRLVELMHSQVHSLAYRLTRNHHLADEIAQETFLKIYYNVSKLEQVSSFTYWWHRVVYNLANDHFRKKKREQAATQEYREYVEKKESLSNQNDAPLYSSIMELIEQLPEKQKQVFILRELENLPHRDISKMLKIPEGTVWSRLAQARAMLQKQLKKIL